MPVLGSESDMGNSDQDLDSDQEDNNLVSKCDQICKKGLYPAF